MGARFEIVVTDSSQGKPRDDRTPRDDNVPRDDQRPEKQVTGQPPAQQPSPQASTSPAAPQAPPVSSSRSAPSDRQPAPSRQRSSQDSSDPDGKVKSHDDGKQWEKVVGQLASYAESVASTIAGGPVVSQLSAMIGVARPLIGAMRGENTKPPVSDETNRDKMSPIAHPSSQRGNREDGMLPLAADRSSRALDQLAVAAGRASRSIGDPRQPVEQPPTDREQPPGRRRRNQQPVEQPPERQDQKIPPIEAPAQSATEQPPVEGEVTDETLSVIRHLMGRGDDLPDGVSQDTVDAIERLLESGIDFSPSRRAAPVNMPKRSGGPVSPIGDPMAPYEAPESAQHPPQANVRPPHLDALEAAQRLPRTTSGSVPSSDPMAPVIPKPPPGSSPATPALGAPPVAALPKPVLPAPVGAAGATTASTGLGVAGGAGVSVGGGAAAAAIPVAALAAGAVAAAGAVYLLARSGKQAHDVMGPLGVVVTGAVTAISPVAGMLVGPVLKQIQAFGDAVERQVNELAEYSGVLSMAQAQSELREMRTAMSSAQRLAPELSKFENTRSRLGESIDANIVEFRVQMLRLLEPLLPILDRTADFIDIVTDFMKENEGWIEIGVGGAVETALRTVLGDKAVTALKFLQMISASLDSEEDKDITEDPYIDELLSNLGTTGGATGAFGGGGIPPRRRR